MRWLLGIGVVVLLAACSGEAPLRERGAEGGRGAATAPGAVPGRDPMQPSPAGRSWRTSRNAPIEPVSPAQAVPTPRPVAESESRDLAAELRDAVGDIRTCLTGVDPGTATTLRVGVSAAVSVQGVVTRAYANGSIPREALACVEGRASSARLAPPVPFAPRNVSTSIEVRFTPAEPRMVDAPPPPPPRSAGTVTAIQGAGSVVGPGGSSGVPIGAAGGTPIGGGGTPIGGLSGTAIGGPSGTPIGGSY